MKLSEAEQMADPADPGAVENARAGLQAAREAREAAMQEEEQAVAAEQQAAAQEPQQAAEPEAALPDDAMTPDEAPVSMELTGEEEAPAAGTTDGEILADLVANQGTPSPALVEKMKAEGMSEQRIALITGTLWQNAKQVSADIANRAGGKQAWTQIKTWANKNLDPAVRDAINGQLTHGSAEVRALGVDALKARYEAANGPIQSRQIDGRLPNAQPDNPLPEPKDEHDIYALEQDPRHFLPTDEGKRYRAWVRAHKRTWAERSL